MCDDIEMRWIAACVDTTYMVEMFICLKRPEKPPHGETVSEFAFRVELR